MQSKSGNTTCCLNDSAAFGADVQETVRQLAAQMIRKPLATQLDRAANHLVIGLVVAALIIVMSAPGWPTLLGLPGLGLLGFSGAVVGMLSIWNTGRADRE